MTSRLRTIAALILSVAFLMVLPLTLTMTPDTEVEVVQRRPPARLTSNRPSTSAGDGAQTIAGADSHRRIGPEDATSQSSSSAASDAIVPPRIVFITVQSGATPTWCRMLASGTLSGNITVVNLAWGHKYAHIKRPRWIVDFISQEQLSDDAIVFFGDGGDTLFSGMPPQHIAATFGRLSHAADLPPRSPATAGLHAQRARQVAAGGPMLPALLFNAEANCYHQQTFHGSWGVKKGKCLSAYKRHSPNVTSLYRYLNAGAWVGRVWAIKQVFAEVRRRIDKDPSLWCDQSVIGGVYLSGQFRGMLGLDHFNTIFLPTYHLRPERDLCPLGDLVAQPGGHHDQGGVTAAVIAGQAGSSPHGPSMGAAVALPLPNLRMCHSGNIPAFIHFNGKSEGAFTAQVIQRTGWFVAGAAARQAAVQAVRADGVTYLNDLRHPVAIGTVCPHLAFP